MRMSDYDLDCGQDCGMPILLTRRFSMGYDYSDFTERARNVVRKAFELSRNCGISSLEPPILAVTVLQEGRDMVEFVFRKVVADRVAFCQSVAQTVQRLPRSAGQEVSGEAPATLGIFSKAKEVARDAGSRVWPWNISSSRSSRLLARSGTLRAHHAWSCARCERRSPNLLRETSVVLRLVRPRRSRLR